MFAIQKPSDDGKYKAAGLEGFMSTKPKGLPWLKWEMGADSTCHHVRFLNIYGLRDRTGDYGTYEVAEMRVECHGSGENDRSVIKCPPYEAMMGPKNTWCTSLRKEFSRIMREKGWDGSGETSERFAVEIGRHIFSIARHDIQVGRNTCGEFEVKILAEGDDVPF